MNELYSPLREERERRNWSRADVEEMTDGRITAVSLERWEEGKCYPRDENIIVLCELYDKSAEELGLDKRSDIMGTKLTVYGNQEGTPMSDLIRRAIFSNLGLRLTRLVDLWPRRNYRYEELQGEINKAIFDHQALIADGEAAISRREALKSMALVPIQLIGGITIIEAGKVQKTDTNILLKHCAAGITACWYLRRGRDLDFVSDVISFYVSILQPLINSHSDAQRKASAELLAQSFMLKSHLGNEGNLAFTERAIYYSDISEDPTTQALAYRRRAYEHRENKNYQDALADAEKGYGLARSSNVIHPIIHSVTAAGLSLCQAACGKVDDAKVTIAEARDLFDPTMPVPSMSYSESILTSTAARIEQYSHHWEEAVSLYEKSLAAPDISALGTIQEQISYTKTEVNRDDKPRDMGLCVTLLTEAIIRAEELNSKEYIRKARAAYDLLRLVWPREDAIKTLGRDHFGLRNERASNLQEE